MNFQVNALECFSPLGPFPTRATRKYLIPPAADELNGHWLLVDFAKSVYLIVAFNPLYIFGFSYAFFLDLTKPYLTKGYG